MMRAGIVVTAVLLAILTFTAGTVPKRAKRSARQIRQVDTAAMVVVDSAHLRTGLAVQVRKRPVEPIGAEGDSVHWAPLKGAVIVVEDRDNHQLGKVRSGDNGMIYLQLREGTHVLRPQAFPGAMFPHPLESRRVYVTSGQVVQVVIEYDTGVR